MRVSICKTLDKLRIKTLRVQLRASYLSRQDCMHYVAIAVYLLDVLHMIRVSVAPCVMLHITCIHLSVCLSLYLSMKPGGVSGMYPGYRSSKYRHSSSFRLIVCHRSKTRSLFVLKLMHRVSSLKQAVVRLKPYLAAVPFILKRKTSPLEPPNPSLS